MSLETLLLLQTILHAQQLDGRAEDFEDVATRVLVARRELSEAIAAARPGTNRDVEDSRGI